MNRGLKLTFDINTFLTFMAFVLFMISPAALPNGVGIHVDSTSYFNGYMLGASEWGIAAITLLGRRLTDVAAIRAIAWGLIVFHVASAMVMMHAFFTGQSHDVVGLWSNVLIPRLGITVSCIYFGLYKTRAVHMPSEASHS